MEKDNASTLEVLNKIPGQSGLKATYTDMKSGSMHKLKENGAPREPCHLCFVTAHGGSRVLTVAAVYISTSLIRKRRSPQRPT